jgi:hypothetical protein
VNALKEGEKDREEAERRREEAERRREEAERRREEAERRREETEGLQARNTYEFHFRLFINSCGYRNSLQRRISMSSGSR